MRIHHLGVLASLLLAGTCSISAAPRPVDSVRLRGADSEPGQWLMDGRNYSAQRYSTLRAINESNVKDLGLAWYADIGTYRGVVATPLVIDGVLYNISAWDVTTAYNATNGKVLWTYAGWQCIIPVPQAVDAGDGRVLITGAYGAGTVMLTAATTSRTSLNTGAASVQMPDS